MTQNQEWIENYFHGKRVMYGGFVLLDHSLLLVNTEYCPGGQLKLHFPHLKHKVSQTF